MQPSKRCKENASHNTSCIDFNTLGEALHLQCCSQALAPETPDTADTPWEGNNEHGILAVFSFYVILAKKPTNFWGFFKTKIRLIHYLLSLYCISTPKFYSLKSYLNICNMESGSFGVWDRKGTASGFATIR